MEGVLFRASFYVVVFLFVWLLFFFLGSVFERWIHGNEEDNWDNELDDNEKE